MVRPMRKLSDWPEGCLEHAAWQEESGSFGVFDVWQSVETFVSFERRLMPVLGEFGLPQTEPHIVQLHNFVAS
jgi:hypothetical protein